MLATDSSRSVGGSNGAAAATVGDAATIGRHHVFDPLGDGQVEHPRAVGLASTANPATLWTTEEYNSHDGASPVSASC